MRPRQTYQVLEELRISFDAPLYRKAVRLSRNDSLTVMKVYQQWLCLLTDLDYLHPDTLRRDARRLLSDMIKVDVLDLINALAACLAKIYRQDTKGFKSLCSVVSPHLYHLLQNDIDSVSSKASIPCARRLIQVFAYMTRLSLVDIDLSQQMIDSYLATEKRLPTEFPSRIVESLNLIIRRWFGPHSPSTFPNPNHGPGGVAELGRCSLFDKYKLLGKDAFLKYAFPNCEEFSPLGTTSTFDRCSRTIFVPKSYKTFRTISMEPASLMYYQQAVRKAIDEQVSASRYMRSRFDTHDALRNRHLAQAASFTGDYATIDLSSASDSVSHNLVKKLFQGTWILRYLVCLRSPRTLLPDGTTHSLRKYAPMGSALCFPVETIIFSAVCEYVTRVCRFPADYSVYGDDIIVPVACVDLLRSTLEELGFLINEDKSFAAKTDWFRESCGGEYVWGQDVTPLRLSRKYTSQEHDIRFLSLIDLANSCFERNYLVLRQSFLADLREGGCDILFSPLLLHSRNYTNYHLQERYNTRYQRMEVRCSLVRTVYIKNDYDADEVEKIRYYHWLSCSDERQQPRDIWHLKLGGFDSKPLCTSVTRTATSVAREWVCHPTQ